MKIEKSRKETYFFYEKSSIIKKMKFTLYPDEIKNKLIEIDLDILYQQSIRVIVLDVDNTLCSHDEEEISSDKLIWIQHAFELGMDIVLISNNHAPRIERIAKRLGCQYYGFSLKPFPFTYRKMMRKNQWEKENMICIGDQLFTDILGAKFMKLRNIYVHPISEKDIIYTKISRKIENWILKERL